MPFIQALRDWHNFYLLTGTAAATLIGLMFVAVSLGVSLVNAQTANNVEIFVTPTIVHFIAVLVVAAISIIPTQRITQIDVDKEQHMTELLQFGQQALAAQPFSALIGARLTSFAPGSAELVIPIRQELKQQHGFVHGGVISYAADNMLTFAGGSLLGPAVVTSEYKINYVKPAIGETLIARATVIAAGKRQAVCRCDVFVASQGEESLCATAQGTIVSMEPASAWKG
jgi:uncharacterized protein (TIGR00369 family)